MIAYLLFVVLLSPCVLGQTVQERNRNFITRHIKQGMNPNRCDVEMGRRGITAVGSNQCRDLDTFITASAGHVKDVCADAGSVYAANRVMRRSNQPFPVVNCRLRGNNRPPRCEYRGSTATRYIVIRCEQGFPVHFEGFANWSGDKNVWLKLSGKNHGKQ